MVGLRLQSHHHQKREERARGKLGRTLRAITLEDFDVELLDDDEDYTQRKNESVRI